MQNTGKETVTLRTELLDGAAAEDLGRMADGKLAEVSHEEG